MSTKPLTHYTDAELHEAMGNQIVSWSYNDYLAELNRRSSRRQGNAQFILSVVSVVIAVVAIVVAATRS